jgi:prophage tail gpP-like protein
VLLCSGYVDRYMPQMGAQYHTVTITGRGQSGLLVDSSPFHPTGIFESKTVQGIISELAQPFGVTVGIFNAAKAAGQVVDYFAIRRGETVWSESMRLLGDFGATLMGQADGSAVIARAGSTRHGGSISQLQMAKSTPIIAASAVITGDGRYSDYSVTYQNASGVEDTNLLGEAKAKDGGVPFFKYKEVIAATEMNINRARALAQWNASRAAGFGAQAQITVPGFRDVDGRLWQPGNLVFVVSPFLKLEADMCISEARFSQSAQGTVTELTVTDPRAFGGEASGTSGSGSIWGWGIKDILGLF